MNKKCYTLFSIIVTFFIIFIFNITSTVFANEAFQYSNTSDGTFIQNGIKDGNTYNYAYTNTSSIPVDSEGFINYQNRAFLKKQ